MTNFPENITRLVKEDKISSVVDLFGEAYEVVVSEYQDLKGIIILTVDKENIANSVVCGDIDTRDALFALETFKERAMSAE